MKLAKTITVKFDFSESRIVAIVELCQLFGYNESTVRDHIRDEVCRMDDVQYAAWGEQQTQIIIQEVQRRLARINKRS